MKVRRILVVAIYGLFVVSVSFTQQIRNFRQSGPATHQLTAPGLSAAHPSLPLGTQVRVTNQQNGQQAIVTIASRIPASESRIIDLSESAAQSLSLGEGATPVAIEVIESRRPAQREVTPPPPPPEEPEAPPEPEPEPEPVPEPAKKSSSGGCDAGFAGLALLLGVSLLLRKKG